MLSKTITSKDLNRNTITRDYWFHLSKADVAEIELTQKAGGIEKQMNTAVENEDGEALIKLFKYIIGKSYGVKHENGISFIQSEELTREFLMSDAYSELFVELLTSSDAAEVFINGVLPEELRGNLDGSASTSTEVVELPQPAAPITTLPAPDPTGDDIVSNTPAPEYSEDDAPAWFKEQRTPSEKEFKASSPAYQQIAFGWKMQGK